MKGRIHPLRVLLATIVLLKKYTRAHLPARLVLALEQSFKLSFAAARPTGKKFLLIGIDISSSMDSPCLGNDKLTCREATIAIATVLNRIEADVQVTHTPSLSLLNFLLNSLCCFAAGRSPSHICLNHSIQFGDLSINLSEFQETNNL